MTGFSADKYGLSGSTNGEGSVRQSESLGKSGEKRVEFPVVGLLAVLFGHPRFGLGKEGRPLQFIGQQAGDGQGQL